MKLRIISDIHTDINSSKQTTFDFGDDFVICCGDISGDRFSTEEWIRKNIKKGIAIGGNHLGYNLVTGSKDDTITKSINYLQDKFSNGDVRFLENQSIEIDGIVFVACILFADFMLFNQRTTCKLIAKRQLNDFRYVNIIGEDGIAKLITPEDQIRLHNESKDFIDKTCRENPDKKIVVITHHCPSYKSIPDQYKTDLLSAAFASNLEEIIAKYYNLILWCHGHVHSNMNYILHGTRIVANPLGYRTENPLFIEEGFLIDTDEL